MLSRSTKWSTDCRIKPTAPILHLKALLLSVHRRQFVPIIRCMCCKNCDSASLYKDHISTVASFEIRLAWRQFWGFVWQQRKGKINTQETPRIGESLPLRRKWDLFSRGNHLPDCFMGKNSGKCHLQSLIAVMSILQMPTQNFHCRKFKTEAVTNQNFTHYKKLQYEDCTVFVL